MALGFEPRALEHESPPMTTRPGLPPYPMPTLGDTHLIIIEQTISFYSNVLSAVYSFPIQLFANMYSWTLLGLAFSFKSYFFGDSCINIIRHRNYVSLSEQTLLDMRKNQVLQRWRECSVTRLGDLLEFGQLFKACG